MKRIVIWIKVLFWFVNTIKIRQKAIFLSKEQTIEILRRRNCSLIRLGDGELNCLEGRDVHYQEKDAKLQEEMANLVDYYLKKPDNCEYILCMPNEFLMCSGLELAKRRVWVSSWAEFRYRFKKKWNLPLCYGDAFLFAKGNGERYKKIWEEKTQVVFVHNNEEYARRFATKYQKEVFFVKVPSQNAYSEIDEIIAQIREQLQKIQNRQKGIVLISAGPCAKAMVFRLKDEGVPVIDTGHCWDDPLHSK